MSGYEFIEHLKMGAEIAFSQACSLPSMVVVEMEGEDGEPRLNAATVSMLDSKTLASVLGELRRRHARVASVAEGWMVEATPENDIDVMPWEHPRRREVVMLAVFMRDDGNVLWSAPVERPKEGRPRLGEWQSSEIQEAPGAEGEDGG